MVWIIVGQLTASAFDFDRSDGQSHGQKSKILSTVKVTFTNLSYGQSSFDRLNVDLTLFKENPIILIFLI
jgi:hypothetical protein